MRVEMVVTIGCDWSDCAAVLTIRDEQTVRGATARVRAKGWTASYGHHDTTGKGMYYRCAQHGYEHLQLNPRTPLPPTDPRSHQKLHKARPDADSAMCLECGWPVHFAAGVGRSRFSGWRHTQFHGKSYKRPDRKEIAA